MRTTSAWTLAAGIITGVGAAAIALVAFSQVRVTVDRASYGCAP